MDGWKNKKGQEGSWVEVVGGLGEEKYVRTKLYTGKCRIITLKTDPLCVSITNNSPAFLVQ